MIGLTGAGMAERGRVCGRHHVPRLDVYLPPIWGWFAMSWLRRHSYL